MKIGIDISQIAYEGTGVAEATRNLVQNLINIDKENEYILFFSSLRKNINLSAFNISPDSKVTIKKFPLPPTFLHILWNKLHVYPIEYLIGNIDVFITSDWVEPPVKKAKKVSILHDFIAYKFPEETHEQTEFNLKKLLISPNIVHTQKRKLYWAIKEDSIFLCVSEATKKDAMEILGIPEDKLKVVYWGA